MKGPRRDIFHLRTRNLRPSESAYILLDTHVVHCHAYCSRSARFLPSRCDTESCTATGVSSTAPACCSPRAAPSAACRAPRAGARPRVDASSVCASHVAYCLGAVAGSVHTARSVGVRQRGSGPEGRSGHCYSDGRRVTHLGGASRLRWRSSALHRVAHLDLCPCALTLNLNSPRNPRATRATVRLPRVGRSTWRP
jgi:hypothetical protein